MLLVTCKKAALQHIASSLCDSRSSYLLYYCISILYNKMDILQRLQNQCAHILTKSLQREQITRKFFNIGSKFKIESQNVSLFPYRFWCNNVLSDHVWSLRCCYDGQICSVISELLFDILFHRHIVVMVLALSFCEYVNWVCCDQYVVVDELV